MYCFKSFKKRKSWLSVNESKTTFENAFSSTSFDLIRE